MVSAPSVVRTNSCIQLTLIDIRPIRFGPSVKDTNVRAQVGFIHLRVERTRKLWWRKYLWFNENYTSTPALIANISRSCLSLSTFSFFFSFLVAFIVVFAVGCHQIYLPMIRVALMCTERPMVGWRDGGDTNTKKQCVDGVSTDEDVTIVVLCVVYLLHRAEDDARRLKNGHAMEWVNEIG